MDRPRHLDDPILRLLSFAVGAAILILETEVRLRDARYWVIGLSLLLMGFVTVEQVLDWRRSHKQ